MLTGKTKKNFIEWYNNRPLHTPFHTPYNVFMGKPIEEQIGVYQLFFDSVDKLTETIYLPKISKGWDCYFTEMRGVMQRHETIQEAWIKAIEKANEIYNKR